MAQAQTNNTPGYTTITGKVLNYENYYDEYNTIEIQVDDWTNAYRRSIFTEIDSSGHFTISFFIFQTQNVIIKYKDKWRYVFVAPEETLELNIDAKLFDRTCLNEENEYPKFSYDSRASINGMKYIGVTSRICQNYDHFYYYQLNSLITNHVSSNLEKMNNLTVQEYIKWRDSVYIKQQEELNEIFNTNNYEEYFEDYLKSKYLTSYLIDNFECFSKIKDNYPWIDTMNVKLSLNLINTTIKENSELLKTNPGAYFTIVNNKLYGIFFNIGMYRVMMPYTSESTSVEFTSIENESYKSVLQPLQDMSDAEFNTAQFQSQINSTKLIEDVQVRESLIGHYYTMSLENGNFDYGLEYILSQISNEDIKASLINAHNHFLWRKSNLNSFEFKNEGDTIIDYLKNKYKGKVIYIDFWGTWCPACYGVFEAIPTLKEKVKRQNIIFVYLCCHCNKEKWNETIATYNLDGEHIFLSSEQYAYLAQKFNLIGVPKFIIIDRYGNIVNDRAPRPENIPILIDKVVTELTKYMK